MMPYKYSVNEVLPFGAASVNPQLLEEMLIGHTTIADRLEKSVISIVENRVNHFILLIGDPGVGKTHLIKVLYSRITQFKQDGRLNIAFCLGKGYGVDSYFDFLYRVLYELIKHNKAAQISLYDRMGELKNKMEVKPQKLLENIIKEIIEETPLLILMEDFDKVMKQLGNEGQGRLRAWLYENDNVSIIASCQYLTDDFKKEDRPFMGFFTCYYLKALSFDDACAFVKLLSNQTGHGSILKMRNADIGAIMRTLYELTQGNHRMLIVFFRNMDKSKQAKMSVGVIKGMYTLDSYFDTFIRDCPQQQQKILRFITSSGQPQRGLDIGNACFMDANTISKQLNLLYKNLLVDGIKDPLNKRNKFYETNDPLLRIHLEMEAGVAEKSLVYYDFLLEFYKEEKIKTARTKQVDLFTKELVFEAMKLSTELQELIQLIIAFIQHENLDGQDLNAADIEVIIACIVKYEQWLPQMQIMVEFLEVYRTLIFEGNKSALYQLPKERRAFFIKVFLKGKGVAYWT